MKIKDLKSSFEVDWAKTFNQFREKVKVDFTYISPKLAALISGVSFLFFVGIANIQAISTFEIALAKTAIHRLKALWGIHPEFSPKFKVFAYDDKTVSALNRPDITLSEWADVIEALAKENPKAILIDKIFQIQDDPDTAAFAQRVKDTGIPVYVGSFVVPRPIPYRSEISDRKDRFSPLNYPNVGLDTFKEKDYYFYGPDERILPGFSDIGHIMYHGKTAVWPFIRSQGLLMPHLALNIANSVEAQKGHVIINGQSVNLLPDQSISLNLGPPEIYRKHAYSMKALILRAFRGKPISVVHPGDIVFLIPGSYTGSTDWVASTHGVVPGGYILASFMNSILTGHWPYFLGSQGLQSAIGCLLGILMGLYFWGRLFWGATVGSLAMIWTLGILLGVFWDVEVSWILPSFAMIATAFCLYGEKSRRSVLERVRIQSGLKIAQYVQDKLFPKENKSHGNIKIHGRCWPAEECSGDWWGQFTLSDSKELVVLADASGHGTAPALATAALHASFLSIIESHREKLANDEMGISDALKTIDANFYTMFKSELMVTMAICLLDTQKETATITIASHCDPLFYSKRTIENRNIVKVDKPLGSYQGYKIVVRGDVVGMGFFGKAKSLTLPMKDGDRLIFYSDGFPERHDKQNKQLGIRAFRKILMRAMEGSAQNVLQASYENSMQFGKKLAPQDDMTMVIIEHSKNDIAAAQDDADQNQHKKHDAA